MADINERKRDDTDTDESVRNSVGAVAGDTIASALDPFGSVAGVGALDNKVEKGTVDKDNQFSKTRDENEVKSSL